jgi:hypothetical protein
VVDNHHADNSQGIAALVGGLIDDSQRLIAQQVTLLRRELQDEWEKARQAGGLLGTGLTILTIGAVLLGFMLVELLHLTGLPYWACYAIAGGGMAIVGGALVQAGATQMNRVSLVPPQTADTLARDVEAVTTTVATGTATPLVRR